MSELLQVSLHDTELDHISRNTMREVFAYATSLLLPQSVAKSSCKPDYALL